VGEHVAILGPNGCGKSTLIKAITRECYPLARDGSSVRIFGRDRWDVFELRATLGIVSSDLMATCTRAVPGRDIVLSGFFPSIGIVMVTHHLSDLIPEIQRVVLMNRGRIQADGLTREILVAPTLSILFGRPLELFERDGYYNLW